MPDSYKRKPKKQLSSNQKKRNRKNSSVRARVEHCFRVIKCQFGYRKVRYKGLEKNRVQVFYVAWVGKSLSIKREARRINSSFGRK